LLTETTLPITEVALAAGFGSLRRFNTTFRDAYRMPRDLRKRRADIGEVLTCSWAIGHRSISRRCSRSCAARIARRRARR
jgi:AraC family transcriptional regulator of adaptative response / DNA-3-methyladenine glycosylase II